MADLTQTITESMTMLGMGEVALWGVFEWGENWGYTGELETETDKCLTNSLTMTDSRANEVDLEPFRNGIAIDESVVEAIMRAWGIWDYVWTRPTSDGDQKVFDESTAVSGTSSTWNAVSDGSADWEDA